MPKKDQRCRLEGGAIVQGRNIFGRIRRGVGGFWDRSVDPKQQQWRSTETTERERDGRNEAPTVVAVVLG